MSLHKSIILEVKEGKLKEVFNYNELLIESRRVHQNTNGEMKEKYRVGFEFFDEVSIKTNVANLAIDEHGKLGAHLKNGLAPKFRRIDRATYLVLGLSEEEEIQSLENENLIGVELINQTSNLNLTMPEKFVSYFENIEYKIYYKRKKITYPEQPCKGFDARLDAYFWPSLDKGYVDNSAQLNQLIAAAKEYLTDLDRHSEEVASLFAKICLWGNVKLPTTDANRVIKNIKLAAELSDHKPAEMNSAWTKLYAIFYPDKFVIYDSRVASSLISIAENVLDSDELLEFKTLYPALGQVPGRGGTRPRSMKTYWPNAYQDWSAQLQSNHLAQSICESINKQIRAQKVTLRDLEAVLFMDGY